MTMKLSVVPIKDSPSLMQIPERLRHLAKDIEEGKYGKSKVCIVVVESEAAVDSFHFGEVSGLFHSAGLLMAAAQEIVS